MSIFKQLLSFKKKLETPFETLNKIHISKEAILNNFDLVKELNPDYSIFPVLKSNAYWHWIKEIAKILNERNIDYIVVDSYFEALKVREVNKTSILLIGYTLPQNLKNMDFRFVSLVVYDLDTIHELWRIWKNVKIHLKIDTWMNRQWIFIEQIKDFISEIKKYPGITLEWICTHLADADNSENSYSKLQIEKFNKAIEIIEQSWIILKYKHLSNSAWWIKFGKNEFNSLRLWISLYWINPFEKNDNDYEKLENLKLALSFESTLILKKELKKWEKVSYNWTFTAQKDMTIGIVPVWYYEWLSRKLSSNYSFSYKSKLLPILWRVCMNLSVVDLWENNINIGDKINIISSNKNELNNIYWLAEKSETITYECLVKLAESIRRVIM